MRSWLVGGIAAISLIGGTAVVAPAATPVARPTVVLKACSAGFTHAIIGGSHKCLRRGQFCASASKRQYVRYGFRCVAGRLR
jgi:hypothetical protein